MTADPAFSIADFRRRVAREAGPFDGDEHGDHRLNPDIGDLIVKPDLRDAAVLVPVVQRADGVKVILTQRTEKLRSHSGQVAFPGGRIDPEDASAAHAALRETHEEIGIEPREVEVIGRMPDYLTGSGYRIVPVFGVVDPGSLHRRMVEGSIRAKQDSIVANFTYSPFDQTGGDGLCTGGVCIKVSMARLLNRTDLMCDVAIPAATDVSEEQSHLGEFVRPRHEVGCEAVLFAAVSEDDRPMLSSEFEKLTCMIADWIAILFGMDFDAHAPRLFEHLASLGVSFFSPWVDHDVLP